MTTHALSTKRVLIGAGSFADAQGALRLARILLARLAPEFGGLLIEETILADVAGLPGQRVVTASGTLVVAPSRRQVQTLLDSDASAFRRSLTALAAPGTCSFERQRGDLVSGLCQAARGWDLLLLGHRATHMWGGDVVLIDPSGHAGDEAATLAHDLALAQDRRLVRMSLDTAPGGRTTGTAHTTSEHFENEAALLARLGRISASAVVLDLAAGPLRTHEQLRQVLEAARCPVLVFGAGRAEPSIAHSTQIPPAPTAP